MKILHLTHTDIPLDSRIIKEIEALERDGHELASVGLSEKLVTYEYCGGVSLGSLSRRLWAPRFLKYFKHLVVYVEFFLRTLFHLRGQRFDVIHCHDTVVLPLAVFLKKIGSIKALVYDAHELESDRNGLTPFFCKLIFLTERALWKWVDHLIVVSDSIAHWYGTKLGNKPSTVILNSPVFHCDSSSTNSGFRSIYNIQDHELIFVYVGIIGPGRGVDDLLKAFKSITNRCHLVFLGYGEHQDRVQEASKHYSNIHFHPRVEHSRVVPLIRSADYGICFIEDVSLSDRYCLPNKLFEYLFAGLPVIGSDLPEIKNLLEKERAGFVSAISQQALKELVVKIERERPVVVIDAESIEKYGWSVQAEKLCKIYSEFPE